VFLHTIKDLIDGEVISVIPDVTTIFLFYGAKTNFLLIVEKVK